MDASNNNLKNAGIRVRFAPSPTGNIHIGGIRTALFNYLFSIQNNGRFILRIDDTDEKRSKKKFEDSIINDLKWFGINWDEFYRQSERKNIYQNALDNLKKNGFIYECFCTEKEILKSKELAIKTKKPYVYNQRCLRINAEEKDRLRKESEEKGINPSLRLNVMKIGLPFIEIEDLVHGRLVFKANLLGDFILKTAGMKDDISGGRFTYNFASTVDDSEMGITHVLRGEDHISNTPRQVLLLKALGKTVPHFAHISLLHGKDGKVMSKRDSASNIFYYKSEGYLPGAILNYLAITGNSFATPSHREIFGNIEEMAPYFDISRTKSSGAIFNEEKLKFINEKLLDNVPSGELFPIMKDKFDYNETIDMAVKEFGMEKTLEILDFLKKEFKTIKDIAGEMNIFLGNFSIKPGTENYEKLKSTALLIKNVLIPHEQSTFDVNFIKGIIKDVSRDAKIPVKECYESLRLFITGKLDGPSILAIAELLGKNRVVKRLEYFAR